jgi:pilus assembly protein Flp/PilA
MPLRGQGLLEYGLIISIVAIMAIAALIVFGSAISDLLSGVSGSV